MLLILFRRNWWVVESMICTELLTIICAAEYVNVASSLSVDALIVRNYEYLHTFCFVDLLTLEMGLFSLEQRCLPCHLCRSVEIRQHMLSRANLLGWIWQGACRSSSGRYSSTDLGWLLNSQAWYPLSETRHHRCFCSDSVGCFNSKLAWEYLQCSCAELYDTHRLFLWVYRSDAKSPFISRYTNNQNLLGWEVLESLQ